jgi:hypothetical protein
MVDQAIGNSSGKFLYPRALGIRKGEQGDGFVIFYIPRACPYVLLISHSFTRVLPRFLYALVIQRYGPRGKIRCWSDPFNEPYIAQLTAL